MSKTNRPNAETQLQVAVGTLLNSLGDKNNTVSETINNSLRKLSEKHPNQVLMSCCNFCKKPTKPSKEHVAMILRLMENVCTDYIVNIDGDAVIETINFTLEIMIEANYEPVTQKPASGILVALAREHYVQVMDALLNHLEAGIVPHYMILHSLGSLANINASRVVTYLKNIFNTLLPLLGGMKTDVIRQACAFAIQNFCEAISEHVSNNNQTTDTTVFSTEIGMTFDVFFNSWLHSRDSKLIENVLDALSAIFAVLNVEKTTQNTTKTITVLLNLYKKNIDSYHVTKCLGSVIKKSASVDGTILEPLLANIFANLVELVCVSPDYAQPELLKSHCEVLRCYECFALHFTDHTLDRLLAHMRSHNERERVRGVIVMTHLVTYSPDQAVRRRYRDVMRQMRDMLPANGSVRGRKAMVQIVVALAHKKVLIDEELNPDGPDKYIEFILKTCCKHPSAKHHDIDEQELTETRNLADSALYMLTTSVPELEDALWHLLNRCFLDPSLDGAVVVSLRCLTHLAAKRDSIDGCEGAFVRCMTLLSNPLPSMRGTYVLNFLKHVKPYVGDGCKGVWEAKLPQLMKYLEQNYDASFNVSEWQDLLFHFWRLVLESVKNGSFHEIVLFKAREQLEVYNQRSPTIDTAIKQTEKHFLLKCVAITVCFVHVTTTILQTIDSLLTDVTDLHACAEAIGICSRTHLDLVLQKLSSIRKDALLKRPSKLFSFLKDQKHEQGTERLRYVVIYSYSEVCNEAPPEKLLKIIQNEILEYVLDELPKSKEFPVKKSCLRAVQSVAEAMHPNRNTLHVLLTDRWRVIDIVSSQMRLHDGAEYIELFPSIITTITSLIRLPIPLESEQRVKFVKLFFDNVYNAAAIYCRIDATKSDAYYGDSKMVPFVTRSFVELNQFVEELLVQDLSPVTLDEIVTLLEPWLGRKKAEQRLPAVETLRLVLKTYLENMKFAYDCPGGFGHTGMLLARVAPRCTDPNKNIRKVAVECVCLILCIASRHEGHLRDHDKILTNSLQHVQQSIDSDEPKLLYNLTCDLAHVICLNLPPFQISHYVDGLIDALSDCESSSSTGSSVILHVTLKNKGGEIQPLVQFITEKILAKMRKITCVRTKSSTLRAVFSLETHHSRIVAGILLSQPLPYDNCICECWAILSTDETLVMDLMDYLKKIIKTTPLYDEQTKNALSAVYALHEIVKNSNLKEICVQQFPELFSILLVCVACYYRDAIRGNITVDTFRLFLTCCQYTKTASCVSSLLDGGADDNYERFLEMVACLVENLCSDAPQSLSWVVASLGPFIRADLEPQRIAVIAFFTHLLKGKANEATVLVEDLLEMVLDVQQDASWLVRRISLQGLGYAAVYLNQELVSRHCNNILGVLMNSLDYHNVGNESGVVLEGMSSFSKLLTAMEGCKFSAAFQVTAAVRIKPLFGHDACDLRRAAFRLLGDLRGSLSADANFEAFKEQIHGNFVTLLLHLCDPDVKVVKACKYTLRKVGPFLDCPKVNAMIQEHLIEEANLHYANFVRDLVKVMSEEMQELFPLLILTSLSYVKSQWVEVRSNAALLTGLLYADIEEESRVSLDAICDRLLRLLSDEHEEVKTKAAQAIAFVFAK